jgi:hypothetical protein
VRKQAGNQDHFVVQSVAERVASYAYTHVDDTSGTGAPEEDLVERAATLLLVMPPNQPRKTIEELVAPHDPERGERAVAALIESAFAVEDADGRLRRLR